MTMTNKNNTFKIGEICPESGVYELINCDEACNVSKEQRTIPLVKGKKFPPCRDCANSNIEWKFIKKA